MLKLLCDVVLAPVRQVSNKDTTVKGTRSGLDVQFLEVLVLQVKEVGINILKIKTEQGMFLGCPGKS